MSESESDTVSNSSTDDEDELNVENTQKMMEMFRNSLQSIISVQNMPVEVKGGSMQLLFNDFKQLEKADNIYQDHMEQLLKLWRQLIDHIEKLAETDQKCFDDCFKIATAPMISDDFFSQMKYDEQFASTISFGILDLLNDPRNLHYLSGLQYITDFQRNIYKLITSLFLWIIMQSVPYTSFKNDDFNAHRYTDLFVNLLMGVENELRSLSTNSSIEESLSEQTDYTLDLFWNLSDQTIIVPWLLDVNMAEKGLEWLKIPNLSQDVLYKVFHIIHNLSRHDEGAERLEKLNALQVIREFQNNPTVRTDDGITLLLSMIMALLSTPDQIRSDNKRMNKILNQLLQMIMNAARAPRHRHDGCHVSEPLAVLAKLFVDDHTVEYVLSHAETDPPLSVSSTVAMFIDLLIDFRGSLKGSDRLKQFTCIALLNILWSVSFHERYRSKLKEHSKFLKTIHMLAKNDGGSVVDQYTPRSMEHIKNAAYGILHNLNEIPITPELVVNAPFSSSIDGQNKPTIMISYSHENMTVCDKILVELEKNRDAFSIWIDRQQCSTNEDVWEKIAGAIKLSALVVCLVSDDYHRSKSCRKEFSFAIKRNKKIVPVYIEQPGECDWLGIGFRLILQDFCFPIVNVLDIHISDLKYVRFKDFTGQLDNSKMAELLTMIRSTIQLTSITVPVRDSEKQITEDSHYSQEVVHTIPISKIRRPFSQWNAMDISDWLKDQKILKELITLYEFQSFKELQRYAADLRINLAKEFTKYAKKYAKKYSGEELDSYIFQRFVTALLSLPEDSTEAFKVQDIQTDFRSVSTTKSSICILI